MKKYRSKNTSAIGYFNLLRGYGMVFVLFFHTRILYFVRRQDNLGPLTITGAGLMMMFFIVSGFGFYKRKPQRCFKTQCNLIIVPYIGMCIFILLERVIYDLIRGIPFSENGANLVATYLFGLCVYPERSIYGIPVSFVGLFWFLLSLFVGWVVYNQISQINDIRIVRLCVISCVLLGWLLPLLSDLWPYCIPQGLLVVGCLCIGESIRKHKLIDNHFSPFIYTIALVWICVSEIMGGGDMGTNTWKLGIFDIISAYLIGILFIKTYTIIYCYIPDNKFTRALEAIGGESFLVFCIHGVERVTIPWYVIQRYIRNPYLGTLVYFVLRCIFIYFAYKAIKCIQRHNNKRKRKNRIKITLE